MPPTDVAVATLTAFGYETIAIPAAGHPAPEQLVFMRRHAVG
jgi:hypothetical protein